MLSQRKIVRKGTEKGEVLNGGNPPDLSRNPAPEGILRTVQGGTIGHAKQKHYGGGVAFLWEKKIIPRIN